MDHLGRQYPGIKQQPQRHAAQQGAAGRRQGNALQRLLPVFAAVGVVAQTDGAVGLQYHVAGLLGVCLVETGQGQAQTNDGALKHAVEHMCHLYAFGLAHVAVAMHVRQGRQRAQQRQRIGLGGRTRLQLSGDAAHRLRQVRQQHLVHQLGQGRKISGRARLADRLAGRCIQQGLPVPAGLHQVDQELRLPGQSPHLVEGAARRVAGARQLPPFDAQQLQAVQQMTSRQVVVLAQVQIERLFQRFGFEPQPLLLGFQVTLQRHHWNALGHLAQRIAHHQAFADQLHGRIVAIADDRTAGFGNIVQAGGRMLAQCGQGVGQARGFDQVRRRTIQSVLAQQASDPGVPAHGALRMLAGVTPQMVVPAGRVHTGPVATGAAEMTVGPRHPGALGAAFGHALQQPVVGGGAVGTQCLRLQCRHVPGTTHHRHVFKLLAGCAQCRTHVCLAHRFVLATPPAQRRRVFTHSGHGLGNGLEQALAFAALFHHVVPPGLAVGVAGGTRQPIQRVGGALFQGRRFLVSNLDIGQRRAFVDRQRRVALGLCLVGGTGLCLPLQGERRRYVHEAHRHIALQRPAHRLPFRRVQRVGVEHRQLRVVHAVGQQCHRRLHAGFQHVREQRLGTGRAFNQQALRRLRFQRGQQAACTARAMMAYAEQGNAVTHRRRSAQTCSRKARYRSFQSSRSLTTVSRYSFHTSASCTGSLTMAPIMPAAMSAGRSTPSPK